MIPLFVNRPFHSVRLLASSTKDTLCELFFKTLSCLSETWRDYANYYSKRNIQRKFTVALYSDYLIQPSFNRLYPGKKVPIPTPQITGNDYELTDNEIINPEISGLCLGACLDHMNRVKASQKPLLESINTIAKKFINGCTKKGFINHYSTRKIDVSDAWCVEKIDDPSFKDLYFAKTISFFAKNYQCHYTSVDIYNAPCGDYLLKEKTADGLHIVCLYKRNEGTAVFDPNYGALFFEDALKLKNFLDNSTKWMFKGESVQYSLFSCDNEERT